MAQSIDIENFVNTQLAAWPLAQHNYAALEGIRRKEFNLGGHTTIVQFNPARKVSTGADMSKAAIAERPCFLCSNNRPKEQQALPFRCSDGKEFDILVNPFPIFSRHLTIVRKVHEEQHLYTKDISEGYQRDTQGISNVRAMSELSQMMPEMAIFFNGANCGASAPDHMHFQASQADAWPLLNEYDICQPSLIRSANDYETYIAQKLNRLVYKIVSKKVEAIEQELAALMRHHDRQDNMINVIMHGGATYVIVRKAFRPWQYRATNEEQRLMISPASVEVGGIFITPVEEHFERITEQDIISIYDQVCFSNHNI